MTSGRGTSANGKTTSHRGLLKLMIKLPCVRGQLQIVAERYDLQELFEAYEEATEMLERLQRGQAKDTGGLLEEYRNLCTEIESDVIRCCIEK